MNPPDKFDLKDYGIDIGLLISGLFGAILLTSKSGAYNLTRTISCLLAGAASANYITTLIVSLTKLNESHYHYRKVVKANKVIPVAKKKSSK